MRDEPGIDTLLSLHDEIIDQGGGYWIKIEAWQVDRTPDIPHGIRYSLSLHEPYGKRILGYDNAHAVKPPKKSSTPDADWPMTTSIGMCRAKGCPTNYRMRTS